MSSISNSLWPDNSNLASKLNLGKYCKYQPKKGPSAHPIIDDIPKTKCIQLYDVRHMIIPRPKDQIPPIIEYVTPEFMANLQKRASSKPREERQQAVKNKKEEEERLRLESNARKAEMEELDSIRKHNIPLNDLEEEAKQKMEQLNKDAYLARQEQEEEIKELNQLILASKAQTIRDAQVKEKLMIKHQHKAFENDLNTIMENERLEGLRREAEEIQRRKEATLKAAAILRDQIQGNAEQRIIEKEKIAQEGEAMKKHFEKLILEDIEEMKEKKMKQKELLNTLLRDNADLKKMAKKIKEQSKSEDRRLLALQRLKREQEEAAEAELREKKHQRELEIQKMREQQEKSSDFKAEQTALQARRAIEEKEREYRRNEKLQALRNREKLKSMEQHRLDHIESEKQARLSKAKEEKSILDYTIQKNKRDLLEEEILRKNKVLENMKHAEEIRSQIKEKEKERINVRKEFFFEGIHKKQEEKLRAQQIQHVKQQKLKDLQNMDIPEKYLLHIYRKFDAKPE